MNSSGIGNITAGHGARAAAIVATATAAAAAGGTTSTASCVHFAFLFVADVPDVVYSIYCLDRDPL